MHVQAGGGEACRASSIGSRGVRSLGAEPEVLEVALRIANIASGPFAAVSEGFQVEFQDRPCFASLEAQAVRLVTTLLAEAEVLL